MTNESLYLTVHGDGIHSALGGPAWVGDSLSELEEWLEEEYDFLVEDELMLPLQEE